MAQSQNQTRPTGGSVDSFVKTIVDDRQRGDTKALIEIMSQVSGEPPKMWGPSIIGFGEFHYKYESGREGDSPIIGFSPRKGTLSVYCMDGADKQQALFSKLGPHKTSKACLYIKRLSDVDTKVLEKIVRSSCATTRARTK